MAPPFPIEMFHGSLTIYNTPGTRQYFGDWSRPGYYFDLTFTYTEDPPQAVAGSAWITPSYHPLGNWPLLTISPPPGLIYSAGRIDATPNPWLGTLLVTG